MHLHVVKVIFRIVRTEGKTSPVALVNHHLYLICKVHKVARASHASSKVVLRRIDGVIGSSIEGAELRYIPTVAILTTQRITERGSSTDGLGVDVLENSCSCGRLGIDLSRCRYISLSNGCLSRSDFRGRLGLSCSRCLCRSHSHLGTSQ